MNPALPTTIGPAFWWLLVRLGVLVSALLLTAPPVVAEMGPVVAEMGPVVALEPCVDGAATREAWQLPYDKAQRAFEHRAQGAEGAWADLAPIRIAVQCFREAVRVAPERFELRVGLMHALLFEGEFAARQEDDKKRAFLEGRDVFEESLDLLGKLVGRDLRKVSPRELDRTLRQHEEARPMFFLGALHWGLWADHFGTVAAVRSGVVKKIRVLAEATLAVTPYVDGGGAHRLMGRLHMLTPRIPFYTSWVSRKRGLEELEKAWAMGPKDPLNLAFLAEAVAEIGKDRPRAKELLNLALASVPRRGHLIEDLSAIEEAKSIRRQLRL